MSGACRLIPGLLLIFMFAIAVIADDTLAGSSSSVRPPAATKKPFEDKVQGHTIADPYRWLEDSSSPETKKWVNDELAYTRSMLDPLPGRDLLHKRLGELLSIGTISAPQLGSSHYFYTKREGTQNQPVLFVREGLKGSRRRPASCCRIPLIARGLPVLLGSWTIPASITRDIPRKEMSPKARKFITATFFIMHWAPIRRRTG